ncbi:hypothetical protein GmRootV15_15070 [Variovorax sp. V15]
MPAVVPIIFATQCVAMRRPTAPYQGVGHEEGKGEEGAARRVIGVAAYATALREHCAGCRKGLS